MKRFEISQATTLLTVFVLVASGLTNARLCVGLTPTLAQDVEDLEEIAVRQAVASVDSSVIRFETIGGTTRVDGVVVSNGPTTGLVVSKDGYVLSASFNFASQPASIFARLPNGKRAGAEIVGRDLSRKIVLLKIRSDFEFDVAPFADSKAVQVGQTVIAVGRVFSAESPSVSTGIISAKNRIWNRAIQTDAKISPANFGGPLLSLTGEVIGVLVPMSPDDEAEMAGTEWYDSGIGFAVPLDQLMTRFDAMKRGKELRKGLIGISLDGTDLFGDAAVVGFCQGSSPASKSGIIPGDTIVEINGQSIARQSEMKHALGALYADDVAKVVVERKGERKTFDVKLEAEIEPFVPPGIGLLIDEQEGDLIVAKVLEEGTAKTAGLLPGDRISQFNGFQLKNRRDLRLKMAACEIGTNVEIVIVRNDKRLSLPVKIGKLTASLNVPSQPDSIPTEVKMVPIKVSEVANQCIALVPRSGNKMRPSSLFVWIPDPGPINEEAIKKEWRDACLAHNAIVMIPQSTNGKTWSPDDVEFVVSAINSLGKRVPFDRSRVVIGGTAANGAMASLVAFRQRQVIQGLALINSNVSKRVRGFETSPVEPLMVLFGTNVPLDNNQRETVERLEKAHFPVLVKHDEEAGSISQWQDDLLNWTRAVDRF